MSVSPPLVSHTRRHFETLRTRRMAGGSQPPLLNPGVTDGSRWLHNDIRNAEPRALAKTRNHLNNAPLAELMERRRLRHQITLFIERKQSTDGEHCREEYKLRTIDSQEVGVCPEGNRYFFYV